MSDNRENVTRKKIFQFQKAQVEAIKDNLSANYNDWVSQGSSVDEIWQSFKRIVLYCLEKFVPTKVIKPNSDPEYYNAEIRRLKRKVGKSCARRKYDEEHEKQFRDLSNKLNCVKKAAYMKTLLSN